MLNTKMIERQRCLVVGTILLFFSVLTETAADTKLGQMLAGRHFSMTTSDLLKEFQTPAELISELKGLCSAKLPGVQKRAAVYLLSLSDHSSAQEALFELLSEESKKKGLANILALNIDKAPSEAFRLQLAESLLAVEAGSSLARVSSEESSQASFSPISSFLSESADTRVRSLVSQ